MANLKTPIVCIAMLLLLLTACNKKEQDNKKEPVNEEPPVEQTEENKDPFYFPLTGMGTTEEPKRRSVAVTINNHPQARPQTGLSKADIVYEILAESSITRFLAIYQSEIPEKVGPIRSARPYFITLAQGYGSLFIAHGYSPEAKEILSSGTIDHLNGMKYDGSLFKRSSERKAPHNSYITYANIEKGAQENGYSMDGSPSPIQFFNEDEFSAENGKSAPNVKVSYSENTQFITEYMFDKATEKYSRYSDNEQTVDYESTDPVLIDNIIVIETGHHVLDSAGRREIDFSSGGKAYLFQKGIVKELEWKNENGQILPFENGEQTKLIPGKTWINVVPDIESVSYSE